MKILFCGAHPDDAEIYAFGTLLAWREAGASVTIFIAAQGNMGTKDRTLGRDLSEVRHAEAESSAAMIGAKLVTAGLTDLGIAPNRFRLANHLQTVAHTERPDVIITHSPNDYHIDHRALSAVVGLAAGDDFPVIHVDTMKGAHFQPTHFVDIGRHQDRKFECLRQHHSQKPRRYVLAALELAARRGKQATGLEGQYMEAFRFAPGPKFKHAEKFFPPGTIEAHTIILPAPGGRPLAPGSYQINIDDPTDRTAAQKRA